MEDALELRVGVTLGGIVPGGRVGEVLVPFNDADCVWLSGSAEVTGGVTEP